MTNTRQVHTDKRLTIQQIGRAAAGYKTRLDAARLTGILDKLTAQDLIDLAGLLGDAWNAGGRSKGMDATGDGPKAVAYFRDWVGELKAAATVLLEADGLRAREAAEDLLRIVLVDPSSRKTPRPTARQDAASDPLQSR